MKVSQCSSNFLLKKKKSAEWRDGSAVKSISCFSRGPRLNSQYPYGRSQMSVTQVPVDLTLSQRHVGKKAFLLSHVLVEEYLRNPPSPRHKDH